MMILRAGTPKSGRLDVAAGGVHILPKDREPKDVERNQGDSKNTNDMAAKSPTPANLGR